MAAAVAAREALDERATRLGTLNGIRLVRVAALDTSTPAGEALLEVQFHNSNHLAAVAAAAADPLTGSAFSRDTFPVSGGRRIRAGTASGQVHVSSVTAGQQADVLRLTVTPIGDYSTYTLEFRHPGTDPVFAEVPFRFRPGCFTSDCAPLREGAPAESAPAIDYLARDFDSFRHTLIAAMQHRVPGWRPTSEADLDQTLIELIAAAGDELADYQDRVMNEAYLGTARRRVSLARHARLMGYHVHQGSQASTWLALEVGGTAAGVVPPGLAAWPGDGPGVQTFLTHAPAAVHPLLNRMRPYTWSGAYPALAAGSTRADLLLSGVTQADVESVRDLIRLGGTAGGFTARVTHLVIQEWLNPATGLAAGRSLARRQLLELLPGGDAAQAVFDPVENVWVLRVRWRAQDALRQAYCATVQCPGGVVGDVSLVHGNLARAFHGAPRTVRFLPPGSVLAGPDDLHYEDADPWGTLCRIPDRHLAYRQTATGGEIPPRSTLSPVDGTGRCVWHAAAPSVTVEPAGERWDERITLVHSDDSAEGGDHFVVETDEEGWSTLRFGNGVNGRKLPAGAAVRCCYQVGRGPAGNVGADTLVGLDSSPPHGLLAGAVVWNPFDVTDGLAPEPAAEVVRRAPEAYRYRQSRAVTLGDYVRRAQEVEGVSRAAAAYAWTGSWRTVRVSVDPAGSTELDDVLRARVTRHLEAVRLIGEDLELRAPDFVPLEVTVVACVCGDFWPEDVRWVLEEELSSGWTADGRQGFFHPDRWTFGQPLHASQVVGVVQAVAGVDHVVAVRMRRWRDASAPTAEIVRPRPSEVLLVRGDPDRMEDGAVVLDLRGGRR